MLYSGADLIRTSGVQAERLERLKAHDSAVQPVGAPENSTSNLDQNTQGALLRFARFIHKEGEKKKKPKLSQPETKRAAPGDPYKTAEQREEKLFGRGQVLDVYV